MLERSLRVICARWVTANTAGSSTGWGSSGALFEGLSVSEAQDNGRAKAEALGWSPPYRWGGPLYEDTFNLSARDTTPPSSVPG
jgi:hypothetical protein